MGSGKTTIGRLVAEKLNLPFFDLDHAIIRKSGKSVAEIFEQAGEDEFRRIETECLQEAAYDSAVISTGGGCFPENQEWMHQNGLVIFLDVPFDILTHRIGADSTRPLWKNAEKLFIERRASYEEAHRKIDATGSPEEIAEAITEIVKSQKTPEN